jgi:HupE / UreJ protein
MPNPVSISLFRIVALALCVGFLAPVQAHDLYRGESRIVIRGREVRDTLTLNLLDFPGVDRNGDKVVSQEEFDQSFERVYEVLQQHYFLRSNGPPLRVTRQRHEVFQDHVLSLELLYVFPQDVIALEVHSTLNQLLGPTYVHLVTVILNGKVQEGILDAAHSDAFFTSAGTSRLQTAGRFIWLGVQHIALGYDHLAFLLGLLVATASLRSLVKVITSFTVAHSITLALATFDIVVLPTRLTESMIALSIAYVAAENLIRNRAIERYRITFLFGLVHGFGFSNVLREMQLPRGHLALSLFSFNVGVEIGQLIFVLLLFPLIADLIASGWTKLRPAVSIAVGCLAVYWFIERAFFA